MHSLSFQELLLRLPHNHQPFSNPALSSVYNSTCNILFPVDETHSNEKTSISSPKATSTSSIEPVATSGGMTVVIMNCMIDKSYDLITLNLTGSTLREELAFETEGRK